MAAAWPAVAAKIVQTLPTLPGWGQVAVFDGPPNTGDDPDNWATVGWAGDDSAGSFTQTQNQDGWHVNEDGNVRVDITCQVGDDDGLPIVRARAFDLFGAFDDWVRKHQTLDGLLSTNATVILASDAITSAVGRGIAQTITVSVVYYTETFTP